MVKAKAIVTASLLVSFGVSAYGQGVYTDGLAPTLSIAADEPKTEPEPNLEPAPNPQPEPKADAGAGAGQSVDEAQANRAPRPQPVAKPVVITDAFTNFLGQFQGTQTETFLGLFNSTQPVYLSVSKLFGKVSITCWSKDAPKKLTNSLEEKDLQKAFARGKAEVVYLDDGTEELRVQFVHSRERNQGFIKSLIKPRSRLITSYQLKFHNHELASFRVQQHVSTDAEKLRYLIEAKDVHTVTAPPKGEAKDPRKKDWEF